MFCTKCGEDLPDDSRFCRSCGQTLGAVSTGGGAAAAPARIAQTKAKPKGWFTYWHYFSLLILLFIGGTWYAENKVHYQPTQPQPQLHTKSTGDKAFTVSAGGTSYITFAVPAGAYDITLKGHFSATGGLANDIEAFLLTEDDRVNWENGHTVNTLYKSGAVTQETLNLVLPNGGKYCFVFNNKISPFTPKAVQANFVWTYYTR
jgi:hypothetical protein